MAAKQETVSIEKYVLTLGEQAKHAARAMSMATTAQKNNALETLATLLLERQDSLIEVNQLDLQAGKERGLESAMLDRLELTPQRIKSMSEGLQQIAALEDPIGEISNVVARPSGIKVGQMRVPLGVIGIIYESRPNVTADAAGLCLKAGNAVILRGGSEAINSNRAIGDCIQQALTKAGLPESAVQVIEVTDRAAVSALLRMDQYVSVIIPRGGKGLIERVSKESTIPVIKHLDGNCHVYIDADANKKMAIEIALNAKTHRYGVCNAMETLLVHKDIAENVLPKLEAEYTKHKVELRGCERTQKILAGVVAAKEEDWSAEYLAPILAIKVVDTIDDAIDHIEKYGSHHTDTIVTDDDRNAQRFLREVDSSSVMVNASTRFADGFEYGLGAEIGISTDKLHARGPVGLEGLTTQKYIVYGSGNIRE